MTTTITHLDDGRWLVTRHGLSSHHTTLAAALAEAAWTGHLPAHRPPSASPSPAQPTAEPLHRPGSTTHPWVVSTGAAQTDYADLPGALSGLIRLAERDHAPHLGHHARAEIVRLTGARISTHPSLLVLRTIAATVKPDIYTAADHLPHGHPADLAHPLEAPPQE